MFGPTASPVVQRQSTWHIGPTTWVFTSRSSAWRESSAMSDAAEELLHRRQLRLDPARERQRVARVAADEARRARDPVGEDVRAESARLGHRASRRAARDAVSPPSVCASGTTTCSSARPVSTTSPSSDSSYVPSEISSSATETGITAMPVTDSAAFAYGSRSAGVTAPSRPSASGAPRSRLRRSCGESLARGHGRSFGTVQPGSGCHVAPGLVPPALAPVERLPDPAPSARIAAASAAREAAALHPRVHQLVVFQLPRAVRARGRCRAPGRTCRTPSAVRRGGSWKFTYQCLNVRPGARHIAHTVKASPGRWRISGP